MQTVLVTTDFKTTALDCIPVICEQFKDTELQFIFIHMFKLSDSISDLLMLSRRSREYEHISDDFYKRCNDIKQQRRQVKSIKVDFFYGSTLSIFKNYLEANRVDYILDPLHRSVSKINKSSIDPAVLVKKSGLPVIMLSKPADEKKRGTESAKMALGELLTEA